MSEKRARTAEFSSEILFYPYHLRGSVVAVKYMPCSSEVKQEFTWLRARHIVLLRIDRVH